MSTADQPPPRGNEWVWLIGGVALVAAVALAVAFWSRAPKPAPDAGDEVARLTKQVGSVGPAAVKAAKALGGMGGTAAPAVPALCNCLSQDRPPELRLAAAQALGKIGAPALPAALAAARSLPRDAGFDLVSTSLLEGFAGSCYRDLFRAAGDKANEPILPYVRNALTSVPTPPDVIPELVALLDSPEEHTVVFAVRALARAGEAAHPNLLAALKHPNRKVREAAGSQLANSPPLPAESIPALLDAARGRDPHPWEDVARHGLARAKGDPTPALVRALADPDPCVRNTACVALAELRPKSDAAADALSALLRDDPTCRYWAARALAALGEPARPRLLAAAKSAPAPARAAAVAAIGERDFELSTGDELTLAVLAALESPDHDVRRSAAYALVRRKPPKDEAVARAALDAIRRGVDAGHWTHAFVALWPAERVWPAFPRIAWLLDESYRHRANVVLAWCAGAYAARDQGRPPEDLVRVFLRLNRAELDPPAVAEALARLGTPAVAGVVDLLADPDPGLRDNAARSLAAAVALASWKYRFTGEGPTKGEVVGVILGGLRHPDAAVRLRTAELLAAAADMTDVREYESGVVVAHQLARCLADDDRAVRLGALRALARYPGQAAAGETETLVRLAADPDAETRVAAVAALGRRGDGPAVAPALTRALRHKDAATRKAAAEALGARTPPDPDAVAELIDAMADADEGVREAATKALAASGPQAVAPLVKALRHAKPEVRDGAVFALAALWAVKELAAALDDKDAAARLGACRALGLIGPPAAAAAPALRRAADSDEEEAVRKAAEGAVVAVTRKAEKK